MRLPELSRLAKFHAEVRAARRAETQAIAIYQAEIWALQRAGGSSARDRTLQLCEQILSEEKLHEQEVDSDDVGFGFEVASALLRSSGWLLGFAFSLLPSRLNWKAHVWAEREAAKGYRRAAAAAREAGLFQKEAVFLEIARQENEHAERFRLLLMNFKD
jgi:rubrerythrin